MSDFPPPPDYSGGPQLPPPVAGEWSGYPQSGFHAPYPPGGAPPGYVAYGGTGSYGSAAQPIAGLTKAMLLLLVITAITTALRAIALVLVRSKAVDLSDGTLTSSGFSNSLTFYNSVGVFASLVGIAAAVVQIVWTFRLAKNLQGRGRQLRFGPGATIAINILGGCTLFILNFMMWRDLWQASDPDIAPGDQRWRDSAVAPIIPIWFGIQIATLVGAIFGVGALAIGIGRSSTTDKLAQRLSNDFLIVGLFSLVSVVASVVFILMLQQLAARHQRAMGETTA